MKRGFTLIELLVVIAIIAILASITFPVFVRGRGKKARQAACMSPTSGRSPWMSSHGRRITTRFCPMPSACGRMGGLTPAFSVCPTLGKAFANAYGYNINCCGMPLGWAEYPKIDGVNR